MRAGPAPRKDTVDGIADYSSGRRANAANDGDL
jgi:hypothetical protein